jgi:hypothetical protein
MVRILRSTVAFDDGTVRDLKIAYDLEILDSTVDGTVRDLKIAHDLEILDSTVDLKIAHLEALQMKKGDVARVRAY